MLILTRMTMSEINQSIMLLARISCKSFVREQEQRSALKNELRYIDPEFHQRLALEYLYELQTYGHIYMYRLIQDYEMKAYPYDIYFCKQAQVIMLMIMNNLNHEVAQFPHELVTYGDRYKTFIILFLTMKYLSEMNENETLVINSGHPLFPSHPDTPRIVLSNGMMIPNYSTQSHYEKHDKIVELVLIGSQAKIIHPDTQARIEIALRFNEAIKNGQISEPIVLSRNHHNVSGTDSPFRETADIYSGYQWFRIFNDASRRAKMMLQWDVNNGIARRSWCGNQNGQFNIKRLMEPLLKVTIFLLK